MSAQASLRYAVPEPASLELSVVIPCLNEARTISECVSEALEGIFKAGVLGEVIVSDNGSTDGSQDLARTAGARVIHAKMRGYGAALLAGIEAAKGKYVLMGDADGSYVFDDIEPFLARLRSGYKLVMGNRFGGRIDPGAMPWANRYIGNPVLSGLLNLLYRTGVHDAHCGIRAFDRESFLRTGAMLPGMEFASEMIIRFRQHGFPMSEVPVRLRKDGRGRAPHLRPIADGLRHVRTLLMFSPHFLFLAPGCLVAAIGPISIVVSWLAGKGDFHGHFGPNFLYSCAIATLVGFHAATFSLLAQHFVMPSPGSGWFRRNLESFFRSVWSFGLSVALIAGGATLGVVEFVKYMETQTLPNPARWVIALLAGSLGADIGFIATLMTLLHLLQIRQRSEAGRWPTGAKE